jgi:hypothetical protein
MEKKKKNIGKVGLLGIPLAVLGFGGVALAANPTPPAMPAVPTVSTAPTTQVAPQAGAPAAEPSEAAEQQTLAAKATITADQAKSIAIGKVGGTVTSIQLGDENGTVVYEVAIGTQEVKVNAANGTVTKVEAADTGTEVPEAPGTPETYSPSGVAVFLPPEGWYCHTSNCVFNLKSVQLIQGGQEWNS